MVLQSFLHRFIEDSLPMPRAMVGAGIPEVARTSSAWSVSCRLNEKRKYAEGVTAELI